MGFFTRAFEKTVSVVQNIMGFNTTDNNTTRHRHSYLSCSIGDVLNNLLAENDIGDKVVINKNTKTNSPQKPKQTPQTNKSENKPEEQIPEQQTKTESKVTVNTVKENNNAHQTKADKNVAKSYTQEDLSRLRQELVDKCNKSNINFAKLRINMAALTGKSLIDFNNIDINLHISLITYIMESIDRVNKMQKEVNFTDDKKFEAVITDAALMYHFVTHDNDGNFINIENLTPEELKERRESFDIRLNKRKEEKLAEIESLPEEQKAAAKEALKEELAGYRKHVFDELRKKIPFESAMELMLIVSVKDLGKAATELMESYPIEIRQKIANTMQSIDSLKEYIKTVEGRGEKLDDAIAEKAFEQYHKIFATYKTKENLDLYESQFQEARKNGELSINIARASAMGIGEGAIANIIMSSDEKESFVKQWVSDNDGFLSDSDFAKVEQTAKTYIKELLDKNPELKNNFNKIKNEIKDIIEKTLNREFKPIEKTNDEKNAKNGIPQQSKENSKRIKIAQNTKVQQVNDNVINFVQAYLKKQAEKFDNPAIKKSNQEIAQSLLLGIIDEKKAIENLNNSEHEFIKMCIQNDKLASIYNERINTYIKSENDEKKLEAIISVAPRSIIIKILQNMSGDRHELICELIQYHKVDTNTKTIIENLDSKNIA